MGRGLQRLHTWVLLDVCFSLTTADAAHVHTMHRNRFVEHYNRSFRDAFNKDPDASLLQKFKGIAATWERDFGEAFRATPPPPRRRRGTPTSATRWPHRPTARQP